MSVGTTTRCLKLLAAKKPVAPAVLWERSVCLGGAAVKDGERAVDTDFEMATTLSGWVLRVSAGDPHYKLKHCV